MNNLLQSAKIQVKDSTKYPEKAYIKCQIEQVIGYYSMTGPLQVLDHSGKEITIDELVDRYYANPDSCFLRPDGNLPEEYPADTRNRHDSQDAKSKDENNIEPDRQDSEKLFVQQDMNNLIHSVGANDNVFIDTCKRLSKGSLMGDGRITFELLHSELVASGRFTASEATQAIKDAVEHGNLLEIEWHLFALPSTKRDNDDTLTTANR
jgi:hypothetical protein